ncbi:MAG: DNA primase [Proteobacteria bacterium]|nr:DNA primase [Pseudomonadota bacterium]
MKFPPSFLDDIRARLPVSVVVGRRVKLTRAGREWKGLSPFNQEKTPSFFVNDQKGSFFDFSSGRNGDIFKFVMETEGLSFPEAVERLANEAGVPMPVLSVETEAHEKKRKGLTEAMDLAAAFFSQQLKERTGAAARSYLAARDLSPAVQAEFQLGYAPGERFALRDHLAGKGVPIEVMVEAGLLIAGEDIAVPYDRFRDRVMFPIANARGQIIAFGGRALQKDAQAKYLNSPETPLFHKGATLYNIHRARKAAHDKGRVIAVEGYIDVIAMTRAGFPETVAPLGTALTEDQLKLLWRMDGEPILCFDGDKAGTKAAHRALDVALPELQPGKTLRFVFLPGGQDPDELLRSSGEAAVADAIGRTHSFVDVLFAREAEREPLDTPERRADLEKRLKDLMFTIKDEVVRKYYREALDDRLRALFQRARGGQRGGGQGGSGTAPGLRGQRGRRFQPGPPTPKSPVLVSDRLTRTALFAGPSAVHPREVALVLAALNQPLIVEQEAEMLAGLDIGNRQLAGLRDAVLDLAGGGAHPAPGEVRAEIVERGGSDMLRKIEAQLTPGDSWALPQAEPNEALQRWRDAAHLHIRETTLPKEMREIGEKVARDGDEQALDELYGLVQRREVF